MYNKSRSIDLVICIRDERFVCLPLNLIVQDDLILLAPQQNLFLIKEIIELELDENKVLLILNN